ncbi:putative viral replication protein [anaerobic digester metagenome]
MKDIQRDKWQLTINNPIDKGFDHFMIKKTLIDSFPTIKYFCMADEKGEDGTPHTHVFVALKSRVRFSKFKKHFPPAHIETAKGSVDQNVNYIKKEGEKYENKAYSKINGTFEEWGEKPPNSKGMRADLTELYEQIKAGYTTGQIIEDNQDYILFIDKIERLRLIYLTEKYKNVFRTNLEVIYISGVTRTGKTFGTLKDIGASNTYRVTDYDHPYDSYAGQPVIIYDEFRSQLSISHMLDALDIYPMELKARYTNKYACYETAIIISNRRLEEQYKDVQLSEPESWYAFLARIKKVKYYNKDGTIEVYNSVQDYFDRILSTESILSDEQQEVIETLKGEDGQQEAISMLNDEVGQ